jgi:hypothetical protein
MATAGEHSVQTIHTSAGTYNVDWHLASEIVESYYHSRCAAETAAIVTNNEREWYNPFSWPMPTIKTVEVDWNSCSKQAHDSAGRDMEAYRKGFASDAPAVIGEIFQREAAIATSRDRLRQMMQQVQTFNASSLEKSEKTYDHAMTAAKFIRDGSAGALVLGSTFVTGGASLAALGGGSVLTGYGKYQDTGSIGAGVISGGGTMAIGAFSMGGKALTMAKSTKYYLILAKGGVETASGLTAGDNLGDALFSGATTVVAEGAAAKLFDKAAVKDVFRKMPMPVKITATGGIRARGYMTKSLGKELVTGEAKWVAKATVKGGIKSMKSISNGAAAYGPLAQCTPLPSVERTSMAFVKLEGKGK